MHDGTEHWARSPETQGAYMGESLAIFHFVGGKWEALLGHLDYRLSELGDAVAYIKYRKSLDGGRYRLVRVRMTLEEEW
jgi:hypothetical protein